MSDILMEKRLKQLKGMYGSVKFDGSIYIIGKGAVGSALLFMILKIFIIQQNKIYVIDLRPKEQIINELKKHIDIPQINIITDRITEKNYKQIFANVKPNDLIIDCSIDISTFAMIQLCQEKQCSYVNSSLETWDYKDESDAYKYSLYYKYNELLKYSKSLDKNVHFNAIIGSGCNPGLVSIWAKIGLDKINSYYCKKNNIVEEKISNYGKTAQKLKLQVVHISEIDTQRALDPKKTNEYCNTWSTDAEAFYEEAIAPVEMSFGSHEDINLFKDDVTKYIENVRYIVLDKLCIETFAQSYSPLSKNFIGRLIRHEENLTIGTTFSVIENGVTTYSPSVYYVYHPCNDTICSLVELKEKNYTYQTYFRLLTNEIIDGRDELGLSFFMENGDVFWIGSLLDIVEARAIYENKFNDCINATLVQVMGGYLSGIMHLIKCIEEKKFRGVMCTDDIPYEDAHEIMIPFCGPFVFTKVSDWDFSRKNRVNKFSDIHRNPEGKADWRFHNFLI